MPTVILNGGAQLQAFVVDGAYNNLQTNAERFIKNVQLRMGGMGGVAVDHGPLSALTFASLASTSAIRFCTRRMCHSSHSRRLLRLAGG